MSYTDKELQDDELAFWIKDFKPPLFHENWYNQFFPFNELEGKKVTEIGCGGYPISEYDSNRNISMDLTIVDPLIESLLGKEKYEHLLKYNRFSESALDFTSKLKQDYLVCLNVIDHFNDPDFKFIDNFAKSLKKGGLLWLYYDVRKENSHGHLAIDHNSIIKKIEEIFTIEKIDESVNPTHLGWSTVYKSIRLIGRKK
jgi:2-polyprenyl-3-methyl-5-hydroxy-6-metoxy-1,4-benzoquinol methylase